jgi:hypothetical protein
MVVGVDNDAGGVRDRLGAAASSARRAATSRCNCSILARSMAA